MSTVFKYRIKKIIQIELPVGAKFCYFGPQDEFVFAWFLVDQQAPTEKRVFQVYGTGEEIPEGLKFVSTCQQGPFMWHLFENVKTKEYSGV